MAGFRAQSHQPVLYHEIIHALQPRRGGFYVDGTLGAGGHAAGVLEASSPDGRLLGMDIDPEALSLARANLGKFGERAVIVRASYLELQSHVGMLGWPALDGVLLDLGVSSMQLDTPERGFSFLSDAPLDMRFDPLSPVTAADLVNDLPESELAKILLIYGEERRNRFIARAIVNARPLHTTRQLGDVVLRATRTGGTHRRERVHPATQTFQALRIAVNHELEVLEAALPRAVAALTVGGRLAVISFHSLEDRIVKQFMRLESRDCVCPPRQPVCTCGHRATLIEVTRHPIRPKDDEISRNPRSRSARLRVAEKIESKD